jgi:hypothetical protein
VTRSPGKKRRGRGTRHRQIAGKPTSLDYQVPAERPRHGQGNALGYGNNVEDGVGHPQPSPKRHPPHGHRSQTKWWWVRPRPGLRYSRAPSETREEGGKSKPSENVKQSFHRSVGEPAEGSLTHRVMPTCEPLPLWGCRQAEERGKGCVPAPASSELEPCGLGAAAPRLGFGHPRGGRRPRSTAKARPPLSPKPPLNTGGDRGYPHNHFEKLRLKHLRVAVFGRSL